MNDQHHIRVPLIWSIVTSVVIGGIAWGANNQRTASHGDQIKDLDALTRSHDRSIATITAQYAEIEKQLAYIGRRLDMIQRVQQQEQQ